MPGTRGSVVRTVGPFDASRLFYIGTSHSCIEFSVESILLLKFYNYVVLLSSVDSSIDRT